MAEYNDNQAWGEFGKAAGVAELFERVVALRLYAHEIGKRAYNLELPANYPGVESPPVEFDGDWVSFQAKYAGDLKTPWARIRASVEVALVKKATGYYKLDRIFIYTSGTPGAGKGDGRHTDRIAIDELAASGDIELVWRFGTQVLDAAKGIPDLWALFDSTSPRLRGPEQVADQSIVPATAFVGREDALDQLLAFLEDDRPFLWWAVEGPAGAGKTRLLTEFARRTPSEWSMAWLGAGPERLAHQHVTGPLVLVVDGLLAHGVDELSEMLEFFSATPPAHKLRLLVVDRDPGRWERQLTAGNTNTSARFRYKHALSVDELDREDWATLVRNIAAILKIDSDELLERFPAGEGSTPLDLYLRVQAEVDDVPEAVRKLLADDRKHHYPQVQDSVLDAAASFTIVRSCDRAALGNCEALSHLLGNAAESTDLRLVLGATRGDDPYDSINGIMPDLVGELFVLDRWQLTPLVTPPSLSHAIDLGVPGAVVDFFHRASSDYPSHEALQLLDTDAPEDARRARTWVLAQAAAVPNLYPHQPTLAINLLRHVSRHEPALGFQALLQLLQVRSGRSTTLPSLADLDNPSHHIQVQLPVTGMNDVQGVVLEPALSRSSPRSIGWTGIPLGRESSPACMTN